MFTFTGQNVAVLKDIGATCRGSGKTVFQLRKPGSVATNTASCQRYPVVSHLKSCSLEQRCLAWQAEFSSAIINTKQCEDEDDFKI